MARCYLRDTGNDAEACAQHLVRLAAKDCRAADNVTVVVVCLRDSVLAPVRRDFQGAQSGSQGSMKKSLSSQAFVKIQGALLQG